MLETACSAAVQAVGAPEGGWDTREVSGRCLEVWFQNYVYLPRVFSIPHDGRPMQVLYISIYIPYSMIIIFRWRCFTQDLVSACATFLHVQFPVPVSIFCFSGCPTSVGQ